MGMRLAKLKAAMAATWIDPPKLPSLRCAKWACVGCLSIAPTFRRQAGSKDQPPLQRKDFKSIAAAVLFAVATLSVTYRQNSPYPIRGK